MIDRSGLADFLRSRRTVLQPEDVGIPRGPRRRTSGLRREEVAALCFMSTDYYARLERERGPQPSPAMLASIAQGLHLSRSERDHLFRLAGHQPPPDYGDSDHVSPGLLRIFDRLSDTPAEIVTELGETLRQTVPAVGLVGDLTRYTGPARSIIYRWFTDPAIRDLYPPDDHSFYSRMYASGLRAIATRRGPDSRAAHLVEKLLTKSPEFRDRWAQHEIGIRPRETKRLHHPEVGPMEVNCQILSDPEQGHNLLVYTAPPGTDSHSKLQLLSVIGAPLS